MSELLHIAASPRKSRSHSARIAGEFIRNYKLKNPSDGIVEMNIWDLALPEFDENAINAKFKKISGEACTYEETEKWQDIKRVFESFAGADKFVFSVPMWNFGIPYRLKHFIDVITQPGLAFSFSPDSGYSGLIRNKPALIVAVRGGAYSGMPGDPMDFQLKYLKTILGFMGFSEIRTILAEGVNMPGRREESLKNALAEAATQALTF